MKRGSSNYAKPSVSLAIHVIGYEPYWNILHELNKKTTLPLINELPLHTDCESLNAGRNKFYSELLVK
jgi:hypothetical protein